MGCNAIALDDTNILREEMPTKDQEDQSNCGILEVDKDYGQEVSPTDTRDGASLQRIHFVSTLYCIDATKMNLS